jgi:hypothetical protein
MPTINNPKLTVTLTPPFDDGVQLIEMRKLTIKYTAVFNAFEVSLAGAGLGVTFQEQITIFGVDPGGSLGANQALGPGSSLPAATLSVTTTTINRTVTRKVTRSLLQEDPIAGDHDEIRCRIQIVPIGLPPVSAVAALTNTVLVGG